MEMKIFRQAVALVTAAVCAIAAMGQSDGVKWLKTKHDFGAFSEDQNEVSAQFKFINCTAEPIAITQVNSTCGCTVPSYSQDDIMPGDTGVIDVKYNAVGRPGRFSKSIYVRTTASMERAKLTITGVVIGNSGSVGKRYPVDMGPLKLRTGAAMMGKVMSHTGKTETVDLYNQSADTLRPIISQVPEYLQITPMPAAIPPGELGTLSFYFRGDRCKEWGIVSDSILITPEDGGKSYAFPVVAIVEEDFSKMTQKERDEAPSLSIVGDRIDLGQVPEHSTKSISKSIDLLNRGKNPLIIRRAYSQDQNVKIDVSKTTIKNGKTASVTVTYDPSENPTGVINTKVTIITNDPAQPTRTIRIVGTRN